MVTGVGTDPHIELAQAAQCGDYNMLDTIMSFGEVDIRRPGPNGLSLIMVVVHGAGRDLKPGNHIECAKRLIKTGAPLDEVDRTGRSALHWAVEYDKPEMLEILLKAGANKTILDEEWKEPLDIAVELSLIKCLSAVLRSCSKEELDSPNEEGFTWMMRAAASGNTDVCRELWNCGANPNIIDPKTGRTALHFCAEFDQAEALITLLGCDGNPKVRDKDGRTVAHVAAESEAVGCLHVLIEACSLLIMEQTDDTGKTPLMLACRHEHDQTVKNLIAKNINPLTKDHNGQTALHWCAKNKSGKCVRLLCQYKPAVTKAKDNDSHTALHLACIAGSPEVVNSLLEFDNDTTTMDDEFHTPLHLATVSNNANCIVLLAQNNADVNVSDAHGSYPIHYAATMAKDPEKLPEDAPKPKSSEGDKAGVPALLIAEAEQNRPQENAQRALESLLALLENGASPCVRDSAGAQPLFGAASEGNDSACKLLLDFGAEISAKDNHARTALHAAAQDGHDDVLKTLLDHPDIVGHIDNVDDRGRTSLMYAAASNHNSCVVVLLDAGADPNHKDDKDISVAHCLASIGDIKGLAALKAKGGSFAIKSNSGTYALHEAALAGHSATMQYLIENGAPVDVTDASGITPLHCAIANDKSECCGVLLNNGMKVNPLMRTKDMRFLTPLDYALLNNRPNCAEFLASNNGLPGVIYASIMANRIRLCWRRFRRRKYGRSRPETPVKAGNGLARACTPARTISRQSSPEIVETTPLVTPSVESAGNSALPNITSVHPEAVRKGGSQGEMLPVLNRSQQAKDTMVTRSVKTPPGKLRGGAQTPGSRPQTPKTPAAGEGRGQPLGPGYNRPETPSSSRARTPVSDKRPKTPPNSRRFSPVTPPQVQFASRPDLIDNIESTSTLNNELSIPNAGYILGNRLYEERDNFQNVLGSNNDLASDFVTMKSGKEGPLALTAGGESQTSVTMRNSISHVPSKSIVPIVQDGKAEPGSYPNIPYKNAASTHAPSTHAQSTRTEGGYQMESVKDGGNHSGYTTPYLGPQSERSTKIRPISAGSGESGGMFLEQPDDNQEVESVHHYEMTIPETEAGNEEGAYVDSEAPEDNKPMNEHDSREMVDEECLDEMHRLDNNEHEDLEDEFSRPQASQIEEPEWETQEYVDGRTSVELEGEVDMELHQETEHAESVGEMDQYQEDAVGNEDDAELDDLMRPQEDEDEESFCRAATPNSHCTDFQRDDLSNTSLTRAETPNYIDPVFDPEHNALHLGSGDLDDNECGEMTLKDEIRDAFYTPYLRDYSRTPTGETDSEDETEYEFCNESEDEVSVAVEHTEDEDDDEGFIMIKPSRNPSLPVSAKSSVGQSVGSARPVTSARSGIRAGSGNRSGVSSRKGKHSYAAVTPDNEELENMEKVHGLRLRLEQELDRGHMEETISKANRARVNQEVDSFNRQSTIYKEELKNSRQNTENLYRNVDQFIGQAMEVNNDLEDFVNQESSGRSAKGRGQRVSADNFKSYRSAKMYNTTFSEGQGKDKMYFNRSVDKSLRSKSQTSLDGKEYLYTANRRLQTYEEWMMLKWQEMKDKSLHTVRWTPVRVDPPKEIDLTKPPPAKDVKILYREYDSKSGRINKVVATNPDGAKIEFRADPVADSPEPLPAKTPGPKGRKTPGSKNRKVDSETAAAYKLPAYNFGGYNGQQSGVNPEPWIQ